MTEIYDSGPRLTESSITEFETTYKMSIPPVYRHFLLENNGGRPKQSDFTLAKDKNNDELEWGSVTRFLGINVIETNSLNYVLRVFRDRLPNDLFPIARDPGGNLICISTGTIHSGKVFFWDHEYEVDEGEEPNYDNVYLIAEDFNEFLDNLTD